VIERCPACGGTELEGFYTVDEVPANSCLLLDDETEAVTFPRGRLDLAACHGCGFITNRSFDASLAEYSSRYEETQGFSPTFVDFGQQLARDWVERFELTGKHVLEIGCGKGEFIAWMVDAGAATATGIDPGLHPERLDGDMRGRVEAITDLYTDAYLHLRADAIVCRHTLEHIAPVREFLATVRRHVDGSQVPVLFELPDTQRVLDEAAFWDLYYEHCSYFTAGSLARLFRTSGFDVLDVRRAYGDQYLLIESRPIERVPQTQLPIEEDLQLISDGIRGFTTAYQEMARGWSARLAALRSTGGRAVLWGGGSKAVAFITTLGLTDELAGVVDINPHKQGRFIAGSGHRVVAPLELRTLEPDLVIVANPIYTAEISAELANLGVKADVVAL
jgi:SAM-dependent methyltransferase